METSEAAAGLCGALAGDQARPDAAPDRRGRERPPRRRDRDPCSAFPRRRSPSISPPWSARVSRNRPGRAARSCTPCAIGVRRLLAFLTEACCAGQPELCGDLARLLPRFPRRATRHDPGIQRAVPVHAQFGPLDHGRSASCRSVGGSRFKRLFGRLGPDRRRRMPEVIAKLQQLGHDVSDAAQQVVERVHRA